MTEMDKIRKWLTDALEYSHGTHDLSDIFKGIGDGQYQLWPSSKGCLVTEILQYPKKKVFHVFLGGGEMDQLMDMHEAVIGFAKELGCTELTMSGRAGWARQLKKWGWDHAHTTMKKEI
jgi:hypothetical protein